MAKPVKQEMEHQIQGWGVDLPLENRPGVPREMESEVDYAYGPSHPRQMPRIPVNISVEHRGLSPVFGESVSPSLLSGILRKHAYKLGEGRVARWMTLILADRVNVFEERFKDLGRGILPNPFKEGGWNAELKHNPKRFAARMAVMTAVGLAGALLFRRMIHAKNSQR